ncbi:hypothetical protein ACOBV8_20670 (plasmid) [Pseudoalteromonas espejiana]
MQRKRFRPVYAAGQIALSGSAAWQGTKTTALRAKQLIDLGDDHNCEHLAQRLGSPAAI